MRKRQRGSNPHLRVRTSWEIAAEREKVELVVKAELEKNPQSPGRYYPFNDETRTLYEEYKKRGEAE